MSGLKICLKSSLHEIHMAVSAVVMSSQPHVKSRDQGAETYRKELFLLENFFLITEKKILPR